MHVLNNSLHDALLLGEPIDTCVEALCKKRVYKDVLAVKARRVTELKDEETVWSGSLKGDHKSPFFGKKHQLRKKTPKGKLHLARHIISQRTQPL
jgi:hypothetical protein